MMRYAVEDQGRRRDIRSGAAPTASWPRDDDVLISGRTASVEYDVMIVPGHEYITQAGHARAVSVGLETAQQRGVDLWITVDHVHCLRLATYRQIARGSPQTR